MTPEEFDKRLKELNFEHAKKVHALCKECAISNSPFKIGEVIADSSTIIRIERIEMDPIFRTIPSCVYYGSELKKNLEPKKVQTHVAIFQSNARAV